VDVYDPDIWEVSEIRGQIRRKKAEKQRMSDEMDERIRLYRLQEKQQPDVRSVYDPDFWHEDPVRAARLADRQAENSRRYRDRREAEQQRMRYERRERERSNKLRRCIANPDPDNYYCR
jgi:hypothetical protein